MKLPIFTTIVLLSAVTWFSMKRSTKKMNEEDEKFWEKELSANSVRKKPLTDLDFITVPFDELILEPDSKNPIIADCSQKILSLKDKEIVNLNGITNTDLKLKYGVPNLSHLSECDENYTNLVSALADLAEELNIQKRTEDAVRILQCAIKCKTDVKRSYILLADIYASNEEYDRIEELIESAESLTSASKDGIIKELKKRSIFSPSYQ